MANEINRIENPMSEEQMRVDIEGGLANVERKNELLASEKESNSEKIKSKKLEALKELYSMLEELGVDLGDINSIGEFMAKIEAQDPDLLAIIENALMGLDPDSIPQQQVIPGSEGAPLPPAPGGMPQMPGGMPQMPGGPLPPTPGGQAPGGLMDKFSGLQNQVLRK